MPGEHYVSLATQTVLSQSGLMLARVCITVRSHVYLAWDVVDKAASGLLWEYSPRCSRPTYRYGDKLLH